MNPETSELKEAKKTAIELLAKQNKPHSELITVRQEIFLLIQEANEAEDKSMYADQLQLLKSKEHLLEKEIAKNDQDLLPKLQKVYARIEALEKARGNDVDLERDVYNFGPDAPSAPSFNRNKF